MVACFLKKYVHCEVKKILEVFICGIKYDCHWYPTLGLHYYFFVTLEMSILKFFFTSFVYFFDICHINLFVTLANSTVKMCMDIPIFQSCCIIFCFWLQKTFVGFVPTFIGEFQKSWKNFLTCGICCYVWKPQWKDHNNKCFEVAIKKKVVTVMRL